MKDIGLDCGRLLEFEQVQSSGSLEELIKIFSGFAAPSEVDHLRNSSGDVGTSGNPGQSGDSIGSENGTEELVSMSKKDCDKLRRKEDCREDQSGNKHRKTCEQEEEVEDYKINPLQK